VIGWLLRRLGRTALAIWFVVTAAFVVLYVLPGDPVRAMLGPQAQASTVAEMRTRMGLDQPFFARYLDYTSSLLRGELGTSLRTGAPIGEGLAPKVWATAQLALAALALQLGLGIFLGVAATRQPSRGLPQVVAAIAIVGQCLPPFAVGLLLIHFLGYEVAAFPVGGYGDEIGSRLYHLILPACTLAFFSIGYYAQLVRGEILEVLTSDFIRTARSKGVSERRILFRHALRPAVLPLLGLAGADAALLMGGAVAVEQVFAWPGLGREVVTAIVARDLPVVIGAVLVLSLSVTVAGTIADLLQKILDPRLREP
jgi:peptide/nickel transport system permease protein